MRLQTDKQQDRQEWPTKQIKKKTGQRRMANKIDKQQDKQEWPTKQINDRIDENGQQNRKTTGQTRMAKGIQSLSTTNV